MYKFQLYFEHEHFTYLPIGFELELPVHHPA